MTWIGFQTINNQQNNQQTNSPKLKVSSLTVMNDRGKQQIFTLRNWNQNVCHNNKSFKWLIDHQLLRLTEWQRANSIRSAGLYTVICFHFLHESFVCLVHKTLEGKKRYTPRWYSHIWSPNSETFSSTGLLVYLLGSAGQSVVVPVGTEPLPVCYPSVSVERTFPVMLCEVSSCVFVYLRRREDKKTRLT